MSSEKQWKEIFGMLRRQDSNLTICQTCNRSIYYSVKNNGISSFHTKNSDEQVCCFKHLERISKQLSKKNINTTKK